VRGRTLVVAPTSVVPNWAPRRRASAAGCAYASTTDRARALDPGRRLTLTSYALLRLDADALCAVDWRPWCSTSRRLIKNADSPGRARRRHRAAGAFRIALTGHAESRTGSPRLWSQFQFLSRGLARQPAHFDERYASRRSPPADGAAAGAACARACGRSCCAA
jgi:hypothetical protein